MSGPQVYTTVLGNFRIDIVPAEAGRASVDAIVREEDTFLITSTRKPVSRRRSPMKRLVLDAVQTVSDAAIPGLILVREKQPMEILAIVYDFDQNPACRLEWIRQVIEAILETAQRRRWRSISLPLFGVAHGSLSPGEVIDELIDVLTLAASMPLQNITLQVEGNMLTQTAEVFQRRAAAHGA